MPSRLQWMQAVQTDWEEWHPQDRLAPYVIYKNETGASMPGDSGSPVLKWSSKFKRFYLVAIQKAGYANPNETAVGMQFFKKKNYKKINNF